MKTLAKVTALTIAAALLLSGCSVLGGGGATDVDIEKSVESIDGIRNADFFVDDEKGDGRTDNILQVEVEDGWYVADTPAFANYLLRTVWNYKVEPVDGVKVIILGGVPEGFDWFDSVIDGRPTDISSALPSAFNYFRSYEAGLNPANVIEASTPGMILMYNKAPGGSASPVDGMIKKGDIPEVEPSAVLEPSVNRIKDDVKGSILTFGGWLNDVEAVPYNGVVTVTLLKDGKEVATATDTADHENDNTLRVDIDYNAVEGEGYTVRFDSTPQDGFDTSTREYDFKLF